MSKEDKKEMGVSETLVSTAVSIPNSNSCSSVAEAAGEKRSIPLLYVQSPTNKPTVSTTTGSSVESQSPSCSTQISSSSKISNIIPVSKTINHFQYNGIKLPDSKKK
jgi:hypothetical protein